jgi:hypothetical protein
VRSVTGQLPSLEEVYVTPVPENIPHDFPSLLRPPFRGAVAINGKLLAVFIMRTAPASTPYGKSSSPSRRAERKSHAHRPSPTSSSSSSHIRPFLFLIVDYNPFFLFVLRSLLLFYCFSYFKFYHGHSCILENDVLAKQIVASRFSSSFFLFLVAFVFQQHITIKQHNSFFLLLSKEISFVKRGSGGACICNKKFVIKFFKKKATPFF